MCKELPCGRGIRLESIHLNPKGTTKSNNENREGIFRLATQLSHNKSFAKAEGAVPASTGSHLIRVLETMDR